MKSLIEDKLKQLRSNEEAVISQIVEGRKLLLKAEADLNAIKGAIQVCEQILSEDDKEKKDGTKS